MSEALDGGTAARLRQGLAHPGNWAQLSRFAVVGATGYAANLAVFWTAVHPVGLGHRPAAVLAFLLAVTSNFTLNRAWTFSSSTERLHVQAPRFLAVSSCGLVLNLLVLEALITVGLPALTAQAIAVIVVMPVNFVGHRLWTFRT